MVGEARGFSAAPRRIKPKNTLMRYLGLIFKNALRNRRRSLLTISSLAMSLCVLGVLMALYYALFHGEAPKPQMLRVVTRHKVALAFAMPIYYSDRIARLPGSETGLHLAMVRRTLQG